jgi:hypothetical protein
VTPSEKFRAELERYGVAEDYPQADTIHEDALRLRMDDVNVLPLGVECYIAVRIGERDFEGFVPSAMVTFRDECPIIPGARFPLGDNRVKIRLPASSLGINTWVMTEDEMREVAISSW